MSLRLAAPLAVLALSCGQARVGSPPRFDFMGADPGWTAGFADVPVGQEAAVDFVADHRPLPAPLVGNGLYQRGFNVSDDLCMWFAGRGDGFQPGVEYDLAFRVGIASDAGAGCDTGVAANTYVKVGAVPFPPERVAVSGWWRLNLDHGTPSGGGANALTLGDLRNGLPGCPAMNAPWGARTLDPGARTLRVRAADDGSLWFFVMTDSAFETSYDVYFTFLDVQARAVQ